MLFHRTLQQQRQKHFDIYNNKERNGNISGGSTMKKCNKYFKQIMGKIEKGEDGNTKND